jgi:hypothetical protein
MTAIGTTADEDEPRRLQHIPVTLTYPLRHGRACPGHPRLCSCAGAEGAAQPGRACGPSLVAYSGFAARSGRGGCRSGSTGPVMHEASRKTCVAWCSRKSSRIVGPLAPEKSPDPLVIVLQSGAEAILIVSKSVPSERPLMPRAYPLKQTTTIPVQESDFDVVNGVGTG